MTKHITLRQAPEGKSWKSEVSFSVYITDIHQRSQNLCHFCPVMELNLGVFGFFLVIKMPVHQVHMSLHWLQSEREEKTCVKCHMGHEDHDHIGFDFVFAWVDSKTPKTPNWAPWLTTSLQGGMGGLGFLVYICGLHGNLFSLDFNFERFWCMLYFFSCREALQMLSNQIGLRAQRLDAAGEIHKFNRDIDDAMSRIQV